MGTKNWLLVVNRKSAKVFEILKKPDSLVWIKTLRNPLGTTKNKLMTQDKPGMSRSGYSKAAGLHNLTGEKSPHEDVAVDFSKKISLFLKHHKDQNEFASLTITAEPHMMGLVKKSVDRKLPNLSVKWFSKDMEKMSTEKLETLIFKKKKYFLIKY